MSEKRYCLYVHINKANEKKYYGITSQRPSSRWNHGRGYKNNIYFTRAIEKYGWEEGFIHQVLLENLSRKEANIWEQFYIDYFDTTDNHNGYNIAKGGNGCNGWKMNEEQKRKLKERLRQQFDTPEKRKIWGEKHKGHKMSEENKKHLSVSRLGKNNPAARRVYCVTTDEYFDTIQEAAKKYNIKSPSKIGDCCRGKIQYAKTLPNGEKLVWRYADEK